MEERAIVCRFDRAHRFRMNIAELHPLVMNVSAKTNWFFVKAVLEDGTHGFGECSLNGWERPMLAYFEDLRPELRGKPLPRARAKLRIFPNSPGGLIASAIRSGIEQALLDAEARARSLPVHALLGSKRRYRVRMYANINRATVDRTPAGCARAARRAVQDGFTAVKIAPFDGVTPDACGSRECRALIDAGIARIHATREAIGEHTVLMVDCHWRFDEATAAAVLRELASAKLFWFECPIAEGEDDYPALKRLRKVAHRTGTRLAGAEQQIGVEGFRAFVEGGLYDVVMPDVKYTGGYAEMVRIARLCEKNRVDFSPHNPTGPVCTMASLHIAAVAPAFLLLEHQVGESPPYDELLREGGHPNRRDGCFELTDAPGLGIELDEAVIQAHPYRPLTNVRDSRLGQGGR